MVKIAAIQMCSSNIVDINLEKVAQFIYESSQNDAQIIVLPEMFAIMGLEAIDKIKVREKFGQGRIQAFLSEQARMNNVWIISGTIPIEDKNFEHKIRASCLVFDNTGNCIARYDKIHLFDITLSSTEQYKESDTTQAGDELVVFDTPFGKIGLAICYDIRFPELFRCLLNKGAEIIVLPAAFTVPTGQAHWEILMRSRAIENFCYMIGSCQVGTHPSGRKTYGHSMIVEPWGNIAAINRSNDEGIIYSDIDLTKVYDARKSIPIESHQKIFCNESHLDDQLHNKSNWKCVLF